jgi:hypothetical protein
MKSNTMIAAEALVLDIVALVSPSLVIECHLPSNEAMAEYVSKTYPARFVTAQFVRSTS